MTTAAPAPAPAVTEPRARFTDLLAAEWTKLWSLRSTRWGLGLGALITIGLNAMAAKADYDLIPQMTAQQVAESFWLRDAFSQNSYFIAMIGAGSFGALTITGEYTTGLIRTTFAAVPARRSVVTAKLLVVSAVMLAIGAVVAAASFFGSQAILSGRGGGWSFSHPGVPQAMAASALIIPVSAVVGMGLGALIRHSATATVAVIVTLLMLPELFSGHTYTWVIDINHALPRSAWTGLVDAIPGMWHGRYAEPVGEAWIVLAAWSLVSALTAVFAVDRRDL
ncbi:MULTISPECIES: ABC transporter permease subunit [Kitasatospora]|uniref:ABC transporter permease n=1 Tax=Kitasatospora cystarginea TaxID=58350 RepID=A0ABP5RHK9_9ACTN